MKTGEHPASDKWSPPRAFFLPHPCRSSSSVLSALHGLRCAPIGSCYLLARYLPTYLPPSKYWVG
jgi:hypothetical protein